MGTSGLLCQPPKESNQQQNRRSKLEYLYAPNESDSFLFPIFVQPSLPHALIKWRILIGSGHFASRCGRLVYGQHQSDSRLGIRLVMDWTVSVRRVFSLTAAQRNITRAIQFSHRTSLPGPTIGTTGLKSTAMTTNPTAHEYLPERTVCLTIRTLEAQTRPANNGRAPVIWSPNAAKTKIMMQTQVVILVSI